MLRCALSSTHASRHTRMYSSCPAPQIHRAGHSDENPMHSCIYTPHLISKAFERLRFPLNTLSTGMTPSPTRSIIAITQSQNKTFLHGTPTHPAQSSKSNEDKHWLQSISLHCPGNRRSHRSRRGNAVEVSGSPHKGNHKAGTTASAFALIRRHIQGSLE